MPLGGKYRLVDIPISNCLNSGLRSIYVLTQFNSMSLHRHIQASYKFDNFSRSFVDILAAQQTPEGSQWYQGTADAVRQNMRYFLEQPYDYFLILSGDQLYRMDFRALLHQHIRSGAESRSRRSRCSATAASDFGIMQSGADRRITRFVEKPKDAARAGRAEDRAASCCESIGLADGRGTLPGLDGHLRFQSRGAGRMPGQRPRSISANTSSRRRSASGT